MAASWGRPRISQMLTNGQQGETIRASPAARGFVAPYHDQFRTPQAGRDDTAFRVACAPSFSSPERLSRQREGVLDSTPCRV